MSAPASPRRVASPKRSPKKKARIASKPKAGPSKAHPTTSAMVLAAITSLKDRRGSSLAAIKKHIAITYRVDMDRQIPFIRRYVRTAVKSGVLKQTKGSGASGSFRLGAKATAKPKPPKKAKKATKPRKTKKTRKPRKKAAKSPKKKSTSKAKAKKAKKSSPKKKGKKTVKKTSKK